MLKNRTKLFIMMMCNGKNKVFDITLNTLFESMKYILMFYFVVAIK